jgi:hypothetical protein
MAINPSDTTYAIIAETVEGTTPATPAMLRMDFIPGNTPTYVSDVLTSPTIKPNRASAGQRKLAFRVEGGLDVHFKRDAAIELLLPSALSSGAWAANVIKAGITDTSVTIEKKMLDGTTPIYHRFRGCQVSKFQLDVSASEIAKASFDLIGLARDPAASTIITGATYALPSATLPLTGLDMTSVSISGVSGLVARALTLSVEHDREGRDQFGQANPSSVGTSGFRKVTGNVQFYRTAALNSALATVETDTPNTISFTLGGVGTGYTFTLPAAYTALPADVEDNSKQLISVDFVAGFDNTAGTDLQVTRL